MTDEAFARAARTYGDTIYRVAYHALGSPQDADDAVQEVFLRLFHHRGDFESREHLRRWLLRVTVNYCRDLLKSPWQKRRVSWEEVPEIPVFDRPEQETLYREVMALPEKYRTVLNLFYYEELSVREIGELLGVDTSTVTTRLARARKRLRERLGEDWQDE